MFGRLCFIHLWDCLEVWLCWLGQGRKSTHHRRWFFIFTMATWRGFLDFAVQCQAPVHFFYVETRYSSTYEGLRRNSVLSRNHWAGQTQLSRPWDSCGFPPKNLQLSREAGQLSHRDIPRSGRIVWDTPSSTSTWTSLSKKVRRARET